MLKVCKKCGYERRSTDDIVPDFECPACGAVYAKVEMYLEKQKQKIEQILAGAQSMALT